MAGLFPAGALVQLTVLMMSGYGVRGDFLGVKLPLPAKLNPIHADPSKLDKAKMPKFDLPSPAKLWERQRAVEKVKAVEQKLTSESPAHITEQLHKGEEATKAKAAVIKGQASGLLKQGAEATSTVNIGAATIELKKALDAVGSLKKQRSSGGFASVLRGGSSQMARAVNQSSMQFAGFLRSFGPRASAVVSRSGEALACKFSGDCSPAPDGDVVLPLDPMDPESWAFWGFALFLILAVCGLTFGASRCAWAVGRKGSSLLSEAMVPLTEPSAREPAIQMAPSSGLTHEGLLG